MNKREKLTICAKRIFVFAIIALISFSEACYSYQNFRSLKRIYISVAPATFISDSGSFYTSFASEYASESIGVKYGENGGSDFELTYSVPVSKSYAGMVFDVSHYLPPLKTLADYKSFKFSIKGNVHVPMKIELQKTDAAGKVLKSKALYLADYLDTRTRMMWHNVVIPLKAFNIDPASVTRVAFVFEHDYAISSSYAPAGIVNIDNIEFSLFSPDVLRVDHFGDNWGLNALGGNIGSLNAHTTLFTADGYSAAGFGLTSNYNLSVDTWCGFFMILGGGWTPEACDLSNYRYLSFYVKAKTALQNPTVCKLEIISGSADWKYTTPINSLTTSWQKKKIDLSSVANLQRNAIKQINIIYERSVIAGNDGALTGSVCFDNFQFEK